MEYTWKKGSRIKANANVAGSVLESLRAAGRLTPAALVEASIPYDAPLHNEFEWDDAAAATKYRETQAGYIIRSIEVKIEGTSEPVRAFFKTTSETREYESVQRIMEVESTRESLIESALRELESFKHKYAMLNELAGVFRAIDEIKAGEDAA